MSPGHNISNESEDHDRNEGDFGRDEGVLETVAEEEVVVFVEIVVEEEELIAEIVEEAEQAKEAEEVETLRDKIMEKSVVRP